jgi:hypothetical protein
MCLVLTGECIYVQASDRYLRCYDMSLGLTIHRKSLRGLTFDMDSNDRFFRDMNLT